jgi:hypothetical protein
VLLGPAGGTASAGGEIATGSVRSTGGGACAQAASAAVASKETKMRVRRINSVAKFRTLVQLQKAACGPFCSRCRLPKFTYGVTRPRAKSVVFARCACAASCAPGQGAVTVAASQGGEEWRSRDPLACCNGVLTSPAPSAATCSTAGCGLECGPLTSTLLVRATKFNR